jgi:4,5-DOPA dioxygenase extradiol
MTSSLLPALFIGHGSPMNGIEDNLYTRSWRELGAELPRPKAILCVSAHWVTQGTAVTAVEHPETIHDFGGFPQELFDARYPAPGSLEFAREVQAEAPGADIRLDTAWGLDHGVWTVLLHLFPEADIPVLQLSLDARKSAREHYDLARRLAGLRRKGYLILCSGNLVHNLRRLDFSAPAGAVDGHSWAGAIDEVFKQKILTGDHDALIAYEALGPSAKLAIPDPYHYYPLLYVLGMQEPGEPVSVFNADVVMAAISMTSVRLG